MSKQTNKAKSTFRFPFDIDRRIFLLLAAVFFIFSIKPINKLFFPRFDVDTLKEKIAQSYANQDQEFESFSKDQKLIEAFAKNTLSTDEIEELNENNWGLSLYKSNSLIAWSNERLLISIIPKTFNTPTPYNEEGTVGIVKTKKVTISNQDYILQANFPLYIKYKNEN